jgi:hypothetical protein
MDIAAESMEQFAHKTTILMNQCSLQFRRQFDLIVTRGVLIAPRENLRYQGFFRKEVSLRVGRTE